MKINKVIIEQGDQEQRYTRKTPIGTVHVYFCGDFSVTVAKLSGMSTIDFIRVIWPFVNAADKTYLKQPKND